MNSPYIPPATREKLLNPAKPGGRHKQMIAIALSLLGNGLYPEAVFVQLRHMFPSAGTDAISDDEINSIVDGAVDYNPQPSTPGYRRSQRTAANHTPPAALAQLSTEAITTFLNGYRVSETEIMNRSPVVVPDNAWMMASVFVERLFGADEQVNLVAECAANRDGKLVPTGYGTTRASAEWVARWTERRVVPQGEAGCWIRLNPTDGTGISDANITAFRVALIEFDEVPLETQLAFFAKIRLPIAALVMSGGKSLHAWVRIGAPDAAEIVNLEIAPAFST